MGQLRNVAIAALALIATGAIGADEPSSGLAPGSATCPFDVYHVAGPRTGQTMCYT